VGRKIVICQVQCIFFFGLNLKKKTNPELFWLTQMITKDSKIKMELKWVSVYVLIICVS